MKGMRTAIALTAALLLVLTLWMIAQVRGAADAQPGRSADPPRAQRAPLVQAPSAVVRAAPAAVATPKRSGDATAVCDIGSFPELTPQAAVAVVAAVAEPETRRARTRLIAMLEGAASEHERALGLYLGTAAGDGDPRRRDALAALASVSRDARVYRLAWTACGAASNSPHCERLSAAQWAQLDAGSALPWLHAAHAAAERGDLAAEAEAMFRVAHAGVVDAPLRDLAGLLLRPDVAALPPSQRLGLELELVDQSLARPSPAMQHALAYCRDAAFDRDGSRQQLCHDLATLFAERDRGRPGVALGAALAARVGWSGERQQRLADERDALEWAAQQVLLRFGANGFGCDWTAQQRRWTADLVAQGERSALRGVIVAEQRSIAELAHAWRGARSPLAEGNGAR